MKRIIVIGLVVLSLVGNASALYCWDAGDQKGVYTGNHPQYHSSYQGLYLKWYPSSGGYYLWYAGSGECEVGAGYHISSSTAGKYNFSEGGTGTTHEVIQIDEPTVALYVSEIPLTIYHITGNAGCIDDIELWVRGDIDTLVESTVSTEPYSLTIMSEFDYHLLFSDGWYYNFTCTGDVEYDHDICDYYTLNLLDNCANPLIYPHTTIFRNMTEIIYEGSDNPIKLLPPTEVEIGDYLQIIIDTCDYAVQYNDYASMIEKDLYHPTISWDLNVHVVDDNTLSDISGALVTLSQDCKIIEPDEDHQITQVNGRTIFTGLSNSNFNLSVSKSGYTAYSSSYNVGDAFNCWSDGGGITVYLNTSYDGSDNWDNGTHDDTPADGEGNETLPDNHAWGCGVYFKNTDGVITDTINDTDAYVDMYWWTKGCPATLKFQHQIYTYWYTDLEYSVANNSYEYRRILNANFSDYTNAYRGFIYNSSCECNDIQNLYVINYTYEEETHYENLTAHCWIWDKLSGNEIDYRSDIKCVIYANSTNSTMLDITANSHNGSTLVDSIVLNWADFVSGDPEWYYTWYPDYEYVSGYNYTLNITGFDGYQLDTDEVWTADIIGNTLTVHVTDNHGTLLSYSTVFIEEWGSIATGISTFAEVTGLPDDDIQYKATKSGYISSGWATVTLSGADESVTCVLVAIESTSVIGQKMSDEDIKSIFIPLMYILFIFMLIGAFKYANE